MNLITDTAVQVRETSWCYSSQAWSVALSNGECWNGDMIWLATGCKLDVKQDPLLFGVIKEFPIQVIFIKMHLHAYINVHLNEIECSSRMQSVSP